MNAYLIAIGAGMLAAVPLIAGLAVPGGFLLGLLAPLPLFLVGLHRGWMQALLAGCALALISAFAGGLGLAVAVALMMLVPTGLLVRQALLSRTAADGTTEWYPPGLLVTWLTVCGVGWLLLGMAVFAWETGGLNLEEQVRAALLQSLSTVLASASNQQMENLAAAMAPYALGLSVVSWMTLIGLNGVLAQGLLTRFGRQARPSPDIADLDLPSWLSLALAVLAGVAYLASGPIGFAARNLLLIVLVPFFFAGLAVIHLFCRRFAARTILLIVFYVAIALIGWIAPLVACLGLIDQWAGLRRRLAGRGNSQEEE